MPRGVRLRLLRTARRLARPWIAGPLVVLVAVLGCVGTGLRAGIPSPYVHDEFSYLLAADTFAHGRLTNPPHPLGEHFESFHVLQRPTYSSKYPPAQGLALAAGQVLGGEPIFGTWALSGLLAAALLWALRGWLPGRWALLGTLLVVVRTGFGSYWAQSYWGGYAAALGGALLVGGLRRATTDPRAANGFLSGLGVVVLANSRPYEGFVLCLGGVALLAFALVRASGGRRRALWLRSVLPIVAVVVAGAGWTAVHDRAVTGSAWRLPYVVHTRQYVSMPFFVGQERGPAPSYVHPDLATFHQEIETQHARGLADLPSLAVERLSAIGGFFVGRALALIPLAALLAWRRRGVRTVLAWAGGAWLGHVVMAPFMEHYAAPMAVLVALLFAFGARAWSAARLGRFRFGWLVVLAAVAILSRTAYASFLAGEHDHAVRSLGLAGRRPALIARLQAEGGRHVVVVRYGPRHSPHADWVYNAADIDGAPVVWARDMGDARNRDLLAYFRDRKAWRITVDADLEEPLLEPLPR